MDTVSRAASIIGRKGGLARSDRKTAACRENGKKGGRPAKVKILRKYLDGVIVSCRGTLK
jgi:hypothetical protein